MIKYGYIVGALALAGIIIIAIIIIINKEKLDIKRAKDFSSDVDCERNYDEYNEQKKNTYFKNDCSELRNNQENFRICNKYKRCKRLKENKRGDKIIKKCQKQLCNLLVLKNFNDEKSRRNLMSAGIYD